MGSDEHAMELPAVAPAPSWAAENGFSSLPPVGEVPVPTDSPEEFITKLSAADRPFHVTGWARVKIGPRTLRLAIQSVPSDLFRREHDRLQPKTLRRIFNEEGRRVWDETTAAYTEWQLQGMYLRVLLGVVDLELSDRQRRVVWDPRNNIRAVPEAIQALKDTGITDQQILNILQEINGLTRDVQRAREEDTADFLSP